MFCPNCGKETDGRFCGFCGAPLPEPKAAPVRPSGWPDAPNKAKKSKKSLLIAAAAALVLLIAALLILVPVMRNRQIMKNRQQTSASIMYLFAGQEDKPIRFERWNAGGSYQVLSEYSFDEDGCILEVSSYTYNDGCQTIRYQYDESGVLSSALVTYRDQNGDVTEGNYEMLYDDQLRVKEVRQYFDAESETEVYTYEDGQLVKNEQMKQDGTVRYTRRFIYRDGHIIKIRVNGSTIEYVYDDKGRIAGSEDQYGFLAIRYVYDD